MSAFVFMFSPQTTNISFIEVFNSSCNLTLIFPGQKWPTSEFYANQLCDKMKFSKEILLRECSLQAISDWKISVLSKIISIHTLKLGQSASNSQVPMNLKKIINFVAIAISVHARLTGCLILKWDILDSEKTQKINTYWPELLLFK